VFVYFRAIRRPVCPAARPAVRILKKRSEKVRTYLPSIVKTCYKESSDSNLKEENMNTHLLSKLFPLGEIVITANALRCLDPSDVRAALARHASGDWGDLCMDDKAINDGALAAGCQLISAFRDRKGSRFFIITQGNRSQTTLRLPQDD